MKSLPKYRAERLRLLAHLEKQKQLIHEDMEEIKSSLKPLSVAKQVINEAADSFRDNNFATQTARLALSVLPGRMRHPLLGIAAQLAVPMLVRNVPKLLHLGKEGNENANGDESEASGPLSKLAQKIPTTKAGVLGGLRNAVSKLRHRIKPDTPPTV